MNPFALLVVTLLALMLLAQLALATRQMRHVRAHRARVPAAFAAKIPLAAHQKAADYTVAKTRLGMVEALAGTAMLLIWTFGGGLQFLDGMWADAGLGPVATGTAFMLSVFFIMGVLDLPLLAYQTFVLEARFGFNKTTPALFVSDLLKKALLSLALGGPLILAVLWLMQSAGALWWFYAWLLWTSFTLLMVWAYPAVIAPLFNKFRALDQESMVKHPSAARAHGLHQPGGVRHGRLAPLGPRQRLLHRARKEQAHRLFRHLAAHAE
jgi:STE24 endopeptidase